MKYISDNAKMPKNLQANVLPTDGYMSEIDGKMKSQYPTAEAAEKAALELKRKYPIIKINVFGVKARTRTAVELPE